MLIDAAIIGGGPAGLAAAESIVESGAAVHLFEGQRSVGRKFLVAGSSGLNLTNALAPEAFPEKYGEPKEIWQRILEFYSSEKLRKWAESLGIETYVGTSGRVFPVGGHAAPLLRRWVSALREAGLTMHVRRRLRKIERTTKGWCLSFEDPTGQIEAWETKVAVLAMGGASWPQTGSDGGWPALLEGVRVLPFAPANCGYETEWPASILALAGTPLKNISATSSGKTVTGECVITGYGLEGGVIYQLGPELRTTGKLTLDFKPFTSIEQLVDKLRKPKGALLSTARRRWNLQPAPVELLSLSAPWQDPHALATACKAHEVRFTGPRPIEEAISCAGGIDWNELDDTLMLKKMPGIYAAGEMINWEAPTGGFLLQGSIATGRWAGCHASQIANTWLRHSV